MDRTLRSSAALTLFVIGLFAGVLSACSGDDSGTDKPVMVPPALRELTTRKLFGEMPLDNRLIDPQFALIDGQAWLPYTNTMPTLSRVFLPATPLGQPALFVAASNPRDMMLLGAAKGGTTPLIASVWFGRALGSDDLELVQVSASVLGLFGGHNEASIDLALDGSVEPQVLEQIVWRRFAVRLDVPPIGWAYLSLSNTTTTADLYITSPIISTTTAPLDLAPARQRALSARESQALDAARRAMLQHLGAPAPRR